MNAPKDLLFWIDIETTGLNPHEDVILEIAMVLTDHEGTQLTPFEHMLIYGDYLDGSFQLFWPTIDPVVGEMHKKSGLYDALFRSNTSNRMLEHEAAKKFDKIVTDWATLLEPGQKFRMAGASVHFDKTFLEGHFFITHTVDKYFTHRLMDVSTLKFVVRETHGYVPPTFKGTQHRALDDIAGTIEEYRTINKFIRGIEIRRIQEDNSTRRIQEDKNATGR